MDTNAGKLQPATNDFQKAPDKAPPSPSGKQEDCAQSEANTKDGRKATPNLFPQMPGQPFDAALYKAEMNIINREKEITANQQRAKAYDESNKKRLREIEKGKEAPNQKRPKTDTVTSETDSEVTNKKKDKKKSKTEGGRDPRSEAAAKKTPSKKSRSKRRKMDTSESETDSDSGSSGYKKDRKSSRAEGRRTPRSEEVSKKTTPSKKSTSSKKLTPTKKSTPLKKSEASKSLSKSESKSESKTERSSHKKDATGNGSSTEDVSKKRASKKRGGKAESLLDLQDQSVSNRIDNICSLVCKAAKGDPDMEPNGDRPENMTEVSQTSNCDC